eukprot:PhF_6_TR21182/c0_g2_i1/m.30535
MKWRHVLISISALCIAIAVLMWSSKVHDSTDDVSSQHHTPMVNSVMIEKQIVMAMEAHPIDQTSASSSLSSTSLEELLSPTPSEIQHRKEFMAKYKELSPEQFLAYVADDSRDIPGWKPGRAQPIQCGNLKFYPGYFGVPHEQVVASVYDTPKLRGWSSVLPGKFKTYTFGAGKKRGAEIPSRHEIVQVLYDATEKWLAVCSDLRNPWKWVRSIFL